jgi:dienelactone hydrolase
MRSKLQFRAMGLALAGVSFLSLYCGAQEKQPPAPRAVDLKAADGTPLKATYFSAGKEGPGVLLLHQCNKQRKAWDGLATKLAAAGVNVLTLDFRGFGESSGVAAYKLPPEENAQMLAVTWPSDVDGAYRYLLQQPGVSHEFIGAGGASCGVHQAVLFAQRHPEVKSLVLLSETTNRSGRQFLRSATKLPILMAAADDDDDWGVVEAMQWLASTSPNASTKLIRYSVGGHGVDMFQAHADLPGIIVDWFTATLQKSSESVTASAAAQPRPKESTFLYQLDQTDGIKKAAKIYDEEHRRDATRNTLFSQELLNRVGYEHLATADPRGAVEIFQLNATAFPNSPNVYDGLADAYLASGQKELARQNAKKALELLPTDTADSEARRKEIKESAEQKLKQLGGS